MFKILSSGKVVLILFLLGTALSVVGWLFDKVGEVDALQASLFPEETKALRGIDYLAPDFNRTLNTQSIGFEELVEDWPGVDSQTIVLVRRDGGTMELGTTGNAYFRMHAVTESDEEIEWRSDHARTFFNESIDVAVFRYGAVIFFLGILITLLSGLIEFLKRSLDDSN